MRTRVSAVNSAPALRTDSKLSSEPGTRENRGSTMRRRSLGLFLTLVAAGCGGRPASLRSGTPPSEPPRIASSSTASRSVTSVQNGPPVSLDPGVAPTVVRGPVPNAEAIRTTIRSSPEWLAGARTGMDCSSVEALINRAEIRHKVPPAVALNSWTAERQPCRIVTMPIAATPTLCSKATCSMTTATPSVLPRG
jgi:hypothetical protein